MSFNFSKISLELVTIAPPSPVVKTLFPQKLKMLESPTEPVFFPLIDDPKASAASSIKIFVLYFFWLQQSGYLIFLL